MGAGQRPQLGQGGGLGEAHHLEVAGVDLQQNLGLPPLQGGGVVGGAGLVGGAHLRQPGAAARQDVGHPEAAADLHQLPPGDGHPLPRRQGGEQEEHGGGVVVDRQGPLRAGEGTQQPLRRLPPAAPAAVWQVVFQVRISPGGLAHRLRRPPAQGGAAQVGVEHDAGGVDHPPQGGAGQPLRQAEDGALQLLRAGDGGKGALPQGPAAVVQHLAGGLPLDGVGQGVLRQGGAGEKQIHFGQPAQQFRVHGDTSGWNDCPHYITWEKRFGINFAVFRKTLAFSHKTRNNGH